MTKTKTTNEKESVKQEKEDVAPIYLIDTEVPFPEESAHLVEGGSLIMFFGIGTRDMITNISAELMMSRRLPVDIQSIGIGDTMVLWLLDKRRNEFGDDDGEGAILAARHIYESQIQDCNREAIILALTAHTEIIGQFDVQGNLVEPIPMEEGTKPLTSKDERKPSAFMKLIQKRSSDIPDVHRNFKNVYEARMKWLEDIINEAGFEFYNDTVRAINRNIVKIVGDMPQKDKDGF